jgi:cell wall-associated NlpC family hydrolase
VNKILVALGALGAVVVLLVAVVLSPLGASMSAGSTPTQDARQDIPANYLILYQQAAGTCPGLPWSVLAGIGKVETNHGRLAAPGVTEGANFAGAAGPMQMGIGVGAAGDAFWRFAVDGNGDGRKDPYDPADAIPSAASYLCAALHDNGGDVSKAVFAYNHAQWYVDKVLKIASGYAATAAASAGMAAPGPGVASVVGTALQFAFNQLGKPYAWGCPGPGCDELNSFDCSGLTMTAYAFAGVALPHNARAQWDTAGPHVVSPADLMPGDLVYFATSRADPATIHHVGLYLGGGWMVEAPHRNAVVRVARALRPDYIGATRPALLAGHG